MIARVLPRGLSLSRGLSRQASPLSSTLRFPLRLWVLRAYKLSPKACLYEESSILNSPRPAGSGPRSSTKLPFQGHQRQHAATMRDVPLSSLGLALGSTGRPLPCSGAVFPRCPGFHILPSLPLASLRLLLIHGSLPLGGSRSC